MLNPNDAKVQVSGLTSPSFMRTNHKPSCLQHPRRTKGRGPDQGPRPSSFHLFFQCVLPYFQASTASQYHAKTCPKSGIWLHRVPCARCTIADFIKEHTANEQQQLYFCLFLRLEDTSSFHSDMENGIMPNHLVVQDSFTFALRRTSLGVSI